MSLISAELIKWDYGVISGKLSILIGFGGGYKRDFMEIAFIRVGMLYSLIKVVNVMKCWAEIIEED